MTIQEVLYAVMLLICGSIALKSAYGMVVSAMTLVAGIIAKESFILGSGVVTLLLNGGIAWLAWKGALFAFDKLF